MNIILIGFMGAGKTSLAKILAKKLDFKAIDMDLLIVEKSGRKSVGEIFEKDGELAFREYEILVANEIKDEQNCVITTGGGIVMNKINIDYLKKNGKIIFLKNTFETSQKRIANPHQRPLFKDPKRAKELYDLRLPLYTYYADTIVETDSKHLDEVAEEVIKALKHL
jgi:shikimate kinase